MQRTYLGHLSSHLLDLIIPLYLVLGIFPSTKGYFNYNFSHDFVLKSPGEEDFPDFRSLLKFLSYLARDRFEIRAAKSRLGLQSMK